MGIITSHKLLTRSWTADVAAIETGIERFKRDRAVTNDCHVALFEIERDAQLHVNVTHRRPTKTLGGWAGPAIMPTGFVHNRRFSDSEPSAIIGQIRRMVFAGPA
jgi:hypothetical protein